MNSTLKKVLGIGAVIIGSILITCGITGCNFFDDDSDSGVQPNSSTPTAEIPGLPPDPGEAGKATLAGIDSDNDGVRDDIEIAIYKRYPNDSLKRDALIQGAKALQDAILVGAAIIAGTANPDEPFRVSDRDGLSVACMVQVFGFYASEESGFLEKTLVNTRTRGDAYIAYNGALSDQSFGSPDTDTPCDN